MVADFQGYVHWLDKSTGSLVARERIAKERVSNAPVAVGDTVVVLTDGGKMAAYRATPSAASVAAAVPAAPADLLPPAAHRALRQRRRDARDAETGCAAKHLPHRRRRLRPHLPRLRRPAAPPPDTVGHVLPVVALIGRPNVGKSTLFNAMTGTRDALVADLPGLTRDRQYGFARRTEVPCIVVDTGGLVENADVIESLMIAQTERAISEADRLIVLVDGRAGVTPQDQFVAQLARRSGKPVFLAVNKTEGFDHDIAVADFHQLGLGEPHADCRRA